jgi:hypothetical protein
VAALNNIIKEKDKHIESLERELLTYRRPKPDVSSSTAGRFSAAIASRTSMVDRLSVIGFDPNATVKNAAVALGLVLSSLRFRFKIYLRQTCGQKSTYPLTGFRQGLRLRYRILAGVAGISLETVVSGQVVSDPPLSVVTPGLASPA